MQDMKKIKEKSDISKQSDNIKKTTEGYRSKHKEHQNADKWNILGRVQLFSFYR